MATANAQSPGGAGLTSVSAAPSGAAKGGGRFRLDLAGIPVDAVAPRMRDKVVRVMRQPTLAADGPAEVFRGDLRLYAWLLDHPDRAVQAWRRLGAPCAEIRDLGRGRFGWQDGDGNKIHWEAAVRNDSLRVWYAEGDVHPAPWLPSVPVRVVVVLRFYQDRDGSGGPVLHHQASVYCHTDSITAALITRLLGPGAPRIAEQGLSQLELFYSALVWYIDLHPERMAALFSPS
jgi:hypothetical protein